jgi:cytochrome P450 family 3 subfamily A
LPKYDVALVKKYGKTFGYFDGRLPNLFTTDVDLIRTVFVKDFDNFFNRRVSNDKFSTDVQYHVQ